MPSVPGAGGNVNPSRLPAHDRFRRVSPIDPNPGEGLLTEPTPAVRPWSRERVLMPLSGHPPAGRKPARLHRKCASPAASAGSRGSAERVRMKIISTPTHAISKAIDATGTEANQYRRVRTSAKTVAYFVEPCPRAGFVGLSGRRTAHPDCANDFITQFYRQPASPEDHALRWLKGEYASCA